MRCLSVTAILGLVLSASSLAVGSAAAPALASPVTAVAPARTGAVAATGLMSAPGPGSSHALVFGPVTFVRERGAPQIASAQFSTSGFDGPFVLYLRNGTVDGDAKVSSAEVRLNGDLLFGPSDFSQNRSGMRTSVSPPEESVLDVRLASGPGSELTIWIAGNPRLQIELDETAAVSRELSVEGGTVCAYATDGTEMCLTIPPGALPKAQEISLTPIRAIPNLPLTHGFRHGVDMKPDGIRFLRPAMLEIRPASPPPEGTPLGFMYEAAGQGLHLMPLRQVDGAFRMPIVHFSGSGVGGGTAEDLPPILDTAPTGSVRYWTDLLTQQLLESADPPTDEDVDAYRAVFGEWFWTTVMPYLTEALECGFTDCAGFEEGLSAALVLWFYWDALCQQMGLDKDPYLDSLEQSYRNLLRLRLAQLFAHWDQVCRASSNFCEQDALTNRYLKSLELVQPLIADAGLPSEWCGGILSAMVNSVDLQPQSLRIREREGATLALIARNHLRDVILTPPGLAVSWTSADSSIASVSPSADLFQAHVHGSKPGQTKVTAAANQCGRGLSAEAPVQVLSSEVASIELRPAALRLKLGEEVFVDVILRDARGDELHGWDYRLSVNSSSLAVAAWLDVNPPAYRWMVDVMGHREGRATVEVVEEGSGQRATLEVVVGSPIADLLVELSAPTTLEGDFIYATAKALHEDGRTEAVPALWTQQPDSGNPGEVRLEAYGFGRVRVHGVKRGLVWLTASIGPPDVAAPVVSAPASVRVTFLSFFQVHAHIDRRSEMLDDELLLVGHSQGVVPTRLHLSPGETSWGCVWAMGATGIWPSELPIRWTSSNPSVAEVHAGCDSLPCDCGSGYETSWTIEGKAAGYTEISAEVDGHVATARVWVGALTGFWVPVSSPMPPFFFMQEGDDVWYNEGTVDPWEYSTAPSCLASQVEPPGTWNYLQVRENRVGCGAMGPLYFVLHPYEYMCGPAHGMNKPCSTVAVSQGPAQLVRQHYYPTGCGPVSSTSSFEVVGQTLHHCRWGTGTSCEDGSPEEFRQCWDFERLGTADSAQAWNLLP